MVLVFKGFNYYICLLVKSFISLYYKTIPTLNLSNRFPTVGASKTMVFKNCQRSRISMNNFESDRSLYGNYTMAHRPCYNY